MNLAKYSNDKFEKTFPFSPIFPDGKSTDAKIYIRSTKSKSIMALIDKANKQANQAAAVNIENSIDTVIDRDIEISCAIIDAIEGFTISDEDNTFGFETEKGVIVSTEANIKLLMQNFVFLRKQVGAQANDDSFFYKN